ncbi:MAG: exported protein of unknown function [Parcubacteria group bacterium]|nr:exported protein of unknown function [Parcubacteria group bacterium]
MKKLFAGLLLSLGLLFVSIPSAKALTTIDELQAQVNILLQQISALQNGTQTTPPTYVPTGTFPTVTNNTGFCYTFTQNLKIGDGQTSAQSSMIENLQKALEREGFTITTDEKAAGAVFGVSTEAAVRSFQQKYASDILAPNGLTSGNGFVGVSTRMKLNQLYGCNGTTQLKPPVLVVPITPINPVDTQSVISAPVVNVRVNGNSSTGYMQPQLDLGNVSSVTFSWDSKNASYCNTYGQTKLTFTDGTTWDNRNLPTSGTRTFNTAGQKDGYGALVSYASIGVQCWNSSYKDDTKGMVVTWTSLSNNPSNSTGAGNQVPTAKITASPTTVNVGQPTNLNWSSTNATSCLLLNSEQPYKYGDTTTSGSLTTYGTGLFTLTCKNAYGTSQPSTVNILTATQAPVNPVLTVSTNYACGGNMNLSWTSVSGASTYKIYRNGGPVTSTTNTSWTDTNLTPGASYSYQVMPVVGGVDTYNFSNSASASASASCTAQAVSPLVTLSLNNTTAQVGDRPVLTWKAINSPTYCSSTGNGPGWGGQGKTNLSSDGTTGGTVTSLPAFTAAGAFTYTMTCSNTAGSSNPTSATVNVSAAAVVNPSPAVTFTASPASLPAGGGTTWLSWNATNASSCSIPSLYNANYNGASGNVPVSPTQTTTYTINCNGLGGASSGSVTVTVAPTVAGTKPVMTISASPLTVAPGGQSIITWSATGAVAGTCSSALPTFQNTSGTTAVWPQTTTSYSVTCSNSAGSSTGSVTITVAPNSANTLTAIQALIDSIRKQLGNF